MRVSTREAVMNALIEEKSEVLAALCREHSATRLELFGSGTGTDFDPERSDLDFLVEFAPRSPEEHAVSYFGLLAALQDLFQRNVDLVELKAVQNPYLLESLEETRTLVYVA